MHAPHGERIGIADLAGMKANGERIVMVTAYDYPSAGVADAAGVDVVLVGDSGAMTVLGYDSTVPVTVDEMLVLCRAARRGAHRPLLVGDLPFGSYEGSDADAVATAQRFVKEAGCDAVKLEGGGSSVERARAIVRAGIPVMGHVGLTPQTAASDGGLRARGRTAEEALAVLDAARALEDAGCFSIVFEAMPAAAAAAIALQLSVPVIGIGAGADVDGQVLVFHDLLGIHDGAPARFVKRYDALRDRMIAGVASFTDDVRSSGYPAPEHTYGMPAEEQTRLEELLAAR
ncbi:3-methyl-2-oxobutanoate hydroxymethyltransferase [Microbacterium halotolerans]|uniref:3-methyl-2-oxobutanoate hydroxymethyltransferase n=1 Tax=Microbacterium halotolerans TaxID=246613 RepID=UPI000E6AB394|nr:3-methyl-2-oxobutanoate hydroxymethyltransferase [Microbacterium halotolerans]